MEEILYIGITQTLFSGILIAVKKPRILANQVLAAWLLIICAEMILMLINETLFELYDPGSLDAEERLRVGRFQLEAAQDVLEARRRAVQTQVRNAYRGVLASISRVQALEQAVSSARTALDATQAGFDVGTRTIVDVLLSQRNLYQSITNYYQARYDYLLNFMRLKQAAGTLLERERRQRQLVVHEAVAAFAANVLESRHHERIGG